MSSFTLPRAVKLCSEQFYLPVNSFTFPWAVLLSREQFYFPVSSFTFPWAVLLCREAVFSSFSFPWAVLLYREQFYFTVSSFTLQFYVSSLFCRELFYLPWAILTLSWTAFILTVFTLSWSNLLCREHFFFVGSSFCRLQFAVKHVYFRVYIL